MATGLHRPQRPHRKHWLQLRPRSNIFQDCVFFVQTHQRSLQDVEADIVLIREHGGVVLFSPFDPINKPTHIIVDLPHNTPAYYSHRLPFSYPITQLCDNAQPGDWCFEDLVAFVLLSRAATKSGMAEHPAKMLRTQWLRECTAVGQLIEKGDAYLTWHVDCNRKPHWDELLPSVQRKQDISLDYGPPSPAPAAVHKKVTMVQDSVAPKEARTPLSERPVNSAQDNHLAAKAKGHKRHPSNLARNPTTPLLQISHRRTPSIDIGSSAKARAPSSGSTYRDRPTPKHKRTRTRSDLWESVVSPKEIHSPATPYDFSVLSAAPEVEAQPDVFDSTATYVDETQLDVGGIKTSFISRGGHVTSLSDAQIVVLFADPGVLGNNQHCDIASRTLARGAYVVSDKWVLQSVEAGQSMPFELFLVRPPSKGEKPAVDPCAPTPTTHENLPAQFLPHAGEVKPSHRVEGGSKRKRNVSDIDIDQTGDQELGGTKRRAVEGDA